MSIRAVVAARVSHVQGEEKTSHHTQRDKGDGYAESKSWTVVGHVEDLDVSAIKLSPWERPDLRSWLDRPQDWDALIFAKTDRVFRQADDSFALTKWAKEHRKILVLIDDNIYLDFFTPEDQQDPMTSMMTRLWLFMASFFAEMEGKRFQQRAQDRIAFLRTTDRWGYGIPPYGFLVVDHPTGVGKALGHDPEAQEKLHEIARMLFSGMSKTAIVSKLVADDVPSPQEWVRLRAGKNPKGTRWGHNSLTTVLTSPATQGIKLLDGKPALDKDGNPVRVGPPSFDDETWARIQSEMSERTQSGRSRRHSSNPQLGVAFCPKCGKNAGQRIQESSAGRVHRYYRCANTPRPCAGKAVVADVFDRAVETLFLRTHGHLRIKVRVWREGSDHSHELEQVNQTIENLREDRRLGLFNKPADQELYRSQMTSLLARQEALSGMPVVKSGWVDSYSDETYADIWGRSDIEERRKMLVDAGFRRPINIEDAATDLDWVAELEQASTDLAEWSLRESPFPERP
ncbi:recombinase family protein [Nocardia sp. NPDC059246]|uniref:recombinase family protein n=1 Tax=unclassified Nocardia TaxID=2637762 RepID=UPI0036C1A57A